jgi:hypothetical protein
MFLSSLWLNFRLRNCGQTGASPRSETPVFHHGRGRARSVTARAGKWSVCAPSFTFSRRRLRRNAAGCRTAVEHCSGLFRDFPVPSYADFRRPFPFSMLQLSGDRGSIGCANPCHSRGSGGGAVSLMATRLRWARTAHTRPDSVHEDPPLGQGGGASLPRPHI